MTRTLKIALVLFPLLAPAVRLAEAQRPNPRQAPTAPVDPYGEPAVAGPADPYGEPAPKPKATPDDPYGGSQPSATKARPPGPPLPAKPAPAPKGDAAKRAPVGDVPAGPTDPYAPSKAPVAAIPQRVGISDLVAVQGLLAVQRLDGWLLFDRNGENTIATKLVAPTNHPTRPWFYLIPAKGEPIVLAHSAEQPSFAHLAGRKLAYDGYRDQDKQLRALLKGIKSVAIEYSAKAAVPSASRVDAGTVEMIRGTGVKVRSSETLVQYTKAIWGDAGRTAHYVAAHHVVELRKDALAFIAKRVATGQEVTEYDVQQRLVRGMTMRGLASQTPVVVAGVNTADPGYVPTAARTSPIKRGDVVVISLAAKLDKPEGIWAAHTWVAFVDATVPGAIAKAFETASLARDQALALIADRTRKHRPVTGADVDDAARGFLKKAGVADKIQHRTGHSIDDDFWGSGANLDNFEVKDTRILTPGTGFTVGPGLYFSRAFGVRAEVSVYLAPSGPEVTTPAQDAVEAILKR